MIPMSPTYQTLLAPKGATSFNYQGVNFEVQRDGLILLPPLAAVEALSHGFKEPAGETAERLAAAREREADERKKFEEFQAQRREDADRALAERARVEEADRRQAAINEKARQTREANAASEKTAAEERDRQSRERIAKEERDAEEEKRQAAADDAQAKANEEAEAAAAAAKNKPHGNRR